MNISARLSDLCNAKDGAALVELAFVIPALMLLLYAAIDFGRAFYVGLEVANAAHAGAEYGSLNPSKTAGITAAAQQSAPDLANLAVATPTWGCECSDGSLYSANCTAVPSCTASGTRGNNKVNLVKVTVSSDYHPLLPWPFIPDPVTFSNTATMRGN